MKPCILSPRALLDADEAREWYEDHEPGLGTKFVHALDDGLIRIQQFPNAFPIVAVPFRKCNLNKFPYAAVFETRADCHWVFSIFHSSRNPAELKKLMRK